MLAATLQPDLFFFPRVIACSLLAETWQNHFNQTLAYSSASRTLMFCAMLLCLRHPMRGVFLAVTQSTVQYIIAHILIVSFLSVRVSLPKAYAFSMWWGGVPKLIAPLNDKFVCARNLMGF